MNPPLNYNTAPAAQDMPLQRNKKIYNCVRRNLTNTTPYIMN